MNTIPVHTYADGDYGPPSSVVMNKKEWLLGLFEENIGEWISRTRIARDGKQHGFEMNQVTARISDLREDLFPEGLMIDSRLIDPDTNEWEYKLDIMTPEYRAEFLARRKAGQTESDSLLAALNKRIIELEKVLGEAPVPSLDSDLDLGEWDNVYEAWYARSRETI